MFELLNVSQRLHVKLLQN